MKLLGSHVTRNHSSINRPTLAYLSGVEISRILHSSFTITMGNSGSHDFSVITDYQLFE